MGLRQKSHIFTDYLKTSANEMLSTDSKGTKFSFYNFLISQLQIIQIKVSYQGYQECTKTS